MQAARWRVPGRHCRGRSGLQQFSHGRRPLPHGQLIILDRLREMVRLGAGLDEQGQPGRGEPKRALACLRAIRPAVARHEGPRACASSAPTRCAARAQRRFLDRAREALGHPDRDHLRHRGSAPDLPRGRPHDAERTGATGRRHRRRQHRNHHRRRASTPRAGKPLHGLREHERALLRRRRHHREAHQARAPRCAPRSSSRCGEFPAIRLGSGRRLVRHDPLGRRRDPRAQQRRRRHHARGSRGAHRSGGQGRRCI